MPTVTFVPLALTATVRAGETILDAARRAGAPLGNSCGAIGICARCRVRVTSGAACIDERTTIEARVTQQRGLDAAERLACQAMVRGDCEITTSYWSR